MHWFSFADIIGDIFAAVWGVLVWVDFFLWSRYDPVTGNHISACALINDSACIGIFDDITIRRSCYLTPDYCTVTVFINLLLFIIFGIFFITTLSIFHDSLEKRKNVNKKIA